MENEKMKCNNCGYEEETDYMYCPNCGKKIRKSVFKKKNIILGSIFLLVVFGSLFMVKNIKVDEKIYTQEQDEWEEDEWEEDELENDVEEVEEKAVVVLFI